jgi:hypothetical protein
MRRALTTPRSEALTLHLRGIPALGRLTRLLSRVPLLTGLVHTKLTIARESLVLRVGPWSLEIPLSRILRLRMTPRGIEVATSDGKKVEIVSYAGKTYQWHPHTYDYNEVLCQLVDSARVSSLGRALRGYRARLAEPGSDSAAETSQKPSLLRAQGSG